MLTLSDLPALNATLNGIAALFLVAGYIQIKKGARQAHKRCMISALIASTLFLASYLTYHFTAVAMKPFPGFGIARVIYYVILGTHVPLAAAIVPLALMTTTRGLKSQFVRHRAIARWTLPLWLYVSVTGVVIYLMLYQMY
jgi:putative membrane protein